MEEVTLSPQAENSRFRKIVTLLKLLLCEMNKNSFLSINDYSKMFWKLSLSYEKIYLHYSISFVNSHIASFRFAE